MSEEEAHLIEMEALQAKLDSTLNRAEEAEAKLQWFEQHFKSALEFLSTAKPRAWVLDVNINQATDWEQDVDAFLHPEKYNCSEYLEALTFLKET